jgi:mitochondrial fission protein ELM1
MLTDGEYMVKVTQYGRVPWEIFTVDDVAVDDTFRVYIDALRQEKYQRPFAHEVSFEQWKNNGVTLLREDMRP